MSDTPNVPLLEETLTYIRDHPEEWDQGEWACGTTACFAGHALLLSGHKFDFVKMAEGPPIASYCWTSKGQFRTIRGRACDVLGIGEDIGAKLFHVENDMDDLERIVKDIVNEAKVQAWGTKA